MMGMMIELTIVTDTSDAFERAFAVQAPTERANEPSIGAVSYQRTRKSRLTEHYQHPLSFPASLPQSRD